MVVEAADGGANGVGAGIAAEENTDMWELWRCNPPYMAGPFPHPIDYD
jgi:hypothetical protein